MAEEAPLYDLLLLLATTASDEQRAKVLADVEQAIAKAGGSVERNDQWGRRPTAFQIDHQAEADYHLLQFKSPPSLIEDLSHTLRITDGVLRFRVIKNRPGTPDAPSSPPPVVAAAAAPAGSAASATPAPARAAEPAPETEVAAEDEAAPAAAPQPEPDAADAAEDAAPVAAGEAGDES